MRHRGPDDGWKITMEEVLKSLAFTVVPGIGLTVGIGYSLYEIRRIGETRLSIITLILGLMFFHQAGEFSVFLGSGTFRWSALGETVETTANLVAAGSVYYVLTFTRRERTLRTQVAESQAELNTVTERLELIFNNANDGILLVDLEDDEIVEANRTACEMLRYSRSELLGRSPYELHPHEPQQFEALTDALRADGGARSDQLSCRRGDGSTMPAGVSAARATLNGSTMMLVTIRDNTRQEQYQTQATLLSRVLRHNLRNDMTVVMGRLEQIKATVDDPNVAETASAAIQQCSELVEISDQTRTLNEILDIERQKITNNTDVVPLVQKAVEQMRREYPNAQIELTHPRTAVVQASEDIVWAVENIVENAVVHTDDDEPQVSVDIGCEHVQRDSFQTEWWTVTVSDYGPGIPADEVAVLSNDTARTPTNHGSGLGSWISQQGVKIFDGTL